MANRRKSTWQVSHQLTREDAQRIGREFLHNAALLGREFSSFDLAPVVQWVNHNIQARIGIGRSVLRTRTVALFLMILKIPLTDGVVSHLPTTTARRYSTGVSEVIGSNVRTDNERRLTIWLRDLLKQIHKQSKPTAHGEPTASHDSVPSNVLPQKNSAPAVEPDDRLSRIEDLLARVVGQSQSPTPPSNPRTQSRNGTPVSFDDFRGARRQMDLLHIAVNSLTDKLASANAEHDDRFKRIAGDLLGTQDKLIIALTTVHKLGQRVQTLESLQDQFTTLSYFPEKESDDHPVNSVSPTP